MIDKKNLRFKGVCAAFLKNKCKSRELFLFGKFQACISTVQTSIAINYTKRDIKIEGLGV